jgi:hypothetical protein
MRGVNEILSVFVAFRMHYGESGADGLFLRSVSRNYLPVLSAFLCPLSAREFNDVVGHLNLGAGEGFEPPTFWL